MNKMNKKGFTLIEMLVVIAIIAILVAIIIPTVTSATDKAAAATNAANLRSVKAEVTTAYLTNDQTKYQFSGDAATGVTVTFDEKKLPIAKKCAGLVDADNTYVTITWNSTSKDFDVKYNGHKIIDFSNKAEGK